MKRTHLLTATLPIVLLALALPSAAKNVKVQMKTADGKSAGYIEIKPGGTGVKLLLHVKNLPPGQHALHFHQTASCDGAGFEGAGPHFNPDGKKHGMLNPEGHHAGDMDNFTVESSGEAPRVTVIDKDVTLTPGPHSLLSNGGTSLVVHAKADDMKTDPSGNSGDRIACGVVQAKGQ